MFIHFHNILDIYYLRTTRFADSQGDYSRFSFRLLFFRLTTNLDASDVVIHFHKKLVTDCHLLQLNKSVTIGFDNSAANVMRKLASRLSSG